MHLLVGQLVGEAREFADRERRAQARGREFDDLAPVVARHREDQIGALQHAFREVPRTMTLCVGSVGAEGISELNRLWRHRRVDEGVGAGTADHDVERTQAAAQQLFGQRRSADIARADGEELEHRNCLREWVAG